MTRAANAGGSPGQGVGRGSAINLFGSITAAVGAIGLLALLTRLLGAGEAGAFLSAVAAVTILITATTLGTDTGLIRQMAKTPDGRVPAGLLRVALGPVLVVSGITAVILFLTADHLADLIGDAEHADLIAGHLRAMAPFIPVGAVLSAVLGATRGLGSMNPTVFLDRMARPAAQILFCAVALVIGNTALLGVAWALPFGLAALAAFGWLRAMQPADAADRPAMTRADVRDFWSFTLPRAAASGLQIMIQWVDVLLVGAFMSTRDAGIYAVASRALQLGFFVINAVGQAVQPRLASDYASGSTERLAAIYRRSTVWTVVVVWPVFLAAAITAPTILRVFGPEFVAGATAVAILAASGLFSSAVGSVDMVLLMAGRSTANLVITAAALAINIGFNVALIPTLGISGAALAWGLSRVVAKSLSLWHVTRHVQVTPFSRDLGAVCLIALGSFGLTGLVMRATTEDSVATAVLYLLVASGTYLTLNRGRIPELLQVLRRRAAGPRSTSESHRSDTTARVPSRLTN